MYLIASMSIVSLQRYKKLLVGAIVAVIVGISIFRGEVLKDIADDYFSSDNKNM
jgi:hypothetical protein